MKESKELEIITVPQDEKGSIEIVPFGTDERIKLSVAIVQKMIAVPTRTGKVPDAAQCIKFMMLCKARHLNPFEGDAYMLGYDTQGGPQFSLITAHQVFLKRAEASKGFDGMQSGVIVMAAGTPLEREGDLIYSDEQLLGGWAKVFRKDRTIPFYKRLKLATFNTGRSRWEKDPAGMIVKCAEADALRTAFPTHLGGLYLDEETQPIDIGPVIDRAKIPNSFAPGKIVATSAGNSEDQNPIPPKEPEEPGSPAEPLTPKLPGSEYTEPPSEWGVSATVDLRNLDPKAPKKKPVLKKKAPSSRNNVPPFQKEMLARLKLGNRGPEDLMKIAIGSGWCEIDETWPLSEEKLEVFLDPENWTVLMEGMDNLA
jgi:phage recombination protein Bet